MQHRPPEAVFLEWIDSIPDGQIRAYSEEAGADNATVSRWRNRKTPVNPTLATLKGFAKAFHVTPSELITRGPKDGPPSEELAAAMPSDFMRVPVLLEIAAGRPRFDTSPRDERTKHVDKDHERGSPFLFDRKWLERQVGPIGARVHDAVFLAKVHGDSMAPTIQTGETLMFAKWPDAEALGLYNKSHSLEAMIDSGAVYLVHEPEEGIEGGNTVKRVKFEKKKRRLVIYGDNAAETMPWTIDLRESEGADGGDTRRLQRFLIGKWIPGVRL